MDQSCLKFVVNMLDSQDFGLANILIGRMLVGVAVKMCFMVWPIIITK